MRRVSKYSGRPLLDPFGVWLADELDKRGMTQQAFAAASGISDGVIAGWLYHTPPRWDSCFRVAAGLQLPAWRVLEAAGYPYDGLSGVPTGDRRRTIMRELERVPEDALPEILAFVRTRERPR